MMAMAEKSLAESRKRVPITPKLGGGVNPAPLYCACAVLPPLAPPPLPAAEGLLVSRQPFTRGANQRAPFALPSPSAPRRKDPVGAGPAPPRPSLPWEGRLRGGGGGGGVVKPYKNGGGGGRTAHSVSLPGGCSDRAAPAGGCPRQGPASVVSSSAAQVSPRSPPLKVRGCRGPREPRALPSGVCPR